MVFRYYTNMMSRATRSVAAGLFIIGMSLIGFGFMIFLLPKFFATLASIVFWLMGIGCGVTAVKIFLASRKAENKDIDSSQGYRENVQIHIEEHHSQ